MRYATGEEMATVVAPKRRTRRARARRSGIVGALAGIVVATGLLPGITGGEAATLHSPRAHICVASLPTAWGMPQWVRGCRLGAQGFTSPVVGTVEGTKVVVDASLSGWVYMWNARTGVPMRGWPQPADLVRGQPPTAIDSSPAIAYLDGPGKEPSIVVGLGSEYIKDQNGGVMAWNANGSVRFRFRTKRTFLQWGSGPARYSNSVFATPAIGDITGNGQEDIVFGAWDHYVYALKPNGKILKGFPINRADTIWSSPALADTTHTGKMDIIEGGDAYGWTGPKPGPRCYSGWLSDYRYINGAPRLVWEHCLRETVWSSPAVSTFGNTPVVVVGTSWFYGPRRHTMPTEDELFAYNAANGKRMVGWPVNVGGPSFGSPAIVPPRPGAQPEVIESSCAHCLHGPAIVTAWSEKGRLLWREDLTLHGQLLASPSVGEVTNFNGRSTANDVLIGNDGGLFVLNALNGHKVAGTGALAVNKSCNVNGTPALSEVPGSRTGYMLFTNCGFNGPSRSADEFMRAYNIPAPTAPAPWPMWRANAQRTGVPDPLPAPRRACPEPASKNGYRVVTAAGAVIGVDGAVNCGDLARDLLPENAVGMAPTPDGRGYWIALGDGSVYAFGDASNEGDLRGDRWRGGPAAPGAPVMSIASSGKGSGYYLLAGDGSVYTFGDAVYHGSEGDYRTAGTPVGIATDAATGGYWIVDLSGRVEAFHAPAFGSSRHGNIVGIAAMPDGAGYWLVGGNGTVYAFGRAKNLGSKHGHHIVGITAAPSGRGYYLVSRTGKVFSFGKVKRAASVSRTAGKDPVVAIAAL